MNSMASPLLHLFLLALFGICQGKEAPWFAELESLNSSQKEALEQLKTSMSSAPHDYMKEDIYLVKFLDAADYDASKAATMMNDMIKWRQDNDVDSWRRTSEKFDSMRTRYPGLDDGMDKERRPIRESSYGSWNMLEAINAGRSSQLLDCAIRSMESSTITIRRQQSRGHNGTQWVLIVSMRGFRMETHACAECKTWVSDFIKAYENYYPNTLKEVIIVEAPPVFKVFLSNVKERMMSPKTAKLITVFYGPGTKSAEEYLNERVDPHQLARWFGGKKSAPRIEFA